MTLDHRFRLASLTKPIATWAMLVAVEEGTVALDDAVGQPGCTLRHLLAHAGGYPFDGAEPVAAPGAPADLLQHRDRARRRAHRGAAGIAFADYLAEAVLGPLGMARCSLRGLAGARRLGHGRRRGRVPRRADAPTLIAAGDRRRCRPQQWPDLAGIVPGVGRFDPCPWGLGFEIRGHKRPHWTGRANSAATFGHFGGAGTMMWADPDAGCAAGGAHRPRVRRLVGRGHAAWPELSDAVLAEVAAA